MAQRNREDGVILDDYIVTPLPEIMDTAMAVLSAEPTTRTPGFTSPHQVQAAASSP